MSVPVDTTALPGVAPPNKPAYTISGIVGMDFISRTQLYQEVKSGRLRVRKIGRRTIVLARDLQEWLDSRPCKEGVSASHRERAVESWQSRKRDGRRRKTKVNNKQAATRRQ